MPIGAREKEPQSSDFTLEELEALMELRNGYEADSDAIIKSVNKTNVTERGRELDELNSSYRTARDRILKGRTNPYTPRPRHQRDTDEPQYPAQPQPVTAARKYSPVCLTGAFEQARQDALVREAEELGSGEAVINRLSEGFKNLSTDEQMHAILSAKRKPAMQENGEMQSAGQQKEVESTSAKQHIAEATT